MCRRFNVHFFYYLISVTTAADVALKIVIEHIKSTTAYVLSISVRHALR